MNQKIVTVEQFLEFEKKILDKIDHLFKSKSGQRKQYLKSQDLRKMLGNISHSKLQEMRINGEISFIKLRGMYLYDYDEIIKIIEEHKVNNHGKI